MTETKMLIGSLSNDLLRVATMIQRGSDNGAVRFFAEAQNWNSQLKHKKLKPYIQKIITDLANDKGKDILTMEKAEKYLMYSILLQNYSLHNNF